MFRLSFVATAWSLGAAAAIHMLKGLTLMALATTNAISATEFESFDGEPLMRSSRAVERSQYPTAQIEDRSSHVVRGGKTPGVAQRFMNF